jgi:hypothetical protein
VSAKTHFILLACRRFGKAKRGLQLKLELLRSSMLSEHTVHRKFTEILRGQPTKNRVLASNEIGAHSVPPLDSSAAVTLFFPVFWAYNNEVLCAMQPIALDCFYLQVPKGFRRIGTLLRNI